MILAGRKIIESHSSQKLRIGKTCRLERRLCLQVFVSRQTLVGSSFLCAAGGVRSQGAVDPGESQLACCHLTSCAVLTSIHFNTRPDIPDTKAINEHMSSNHLGSYLSL